MISYGGAVGVERGTPFPAELEQRKVDVVVILKDLKLQSVFHCFPFLRCIKYEWFLNGNELRRGSDTDGLADTFPCPHGTHDFCALVSHIPK